MSMWMNSTTIATRTPILIRSLPQSAASQARPLAPSSPWGAVIGEV